MGLAADSSYALLDRLSSSRASRRQTINILFLGFHPDAVDPILSLIRSGRMAPRGRQVQSREDLLAALSERGWDLLFCGTLEDGHDFPAATAVSLLQGREKDIPVIQLSHDTSQDAQLQAYKDGVAALLPAQPGELLLHVMLQQLQALEDRRRLRQSEAMLEVAERHFHEQVSQSRTPIAYLTDGQIIFVNDSLVELMGVSKSYELIGTELDQLILPEHRQKVADMLHAFSDQHRPIDTSLPLELTRPDNSMFKAQVQFQTCRYQGQPALSMNITPEQFSEEANAAVHRDDDPLTGLKNGSYLIQRLDDTAQHALAGGHDAQLFYIRLDQYEDLLATHGQEATNGLIRLIAERLDKAFYDPHLVCRFEDDSFAIIFRHPNTDESLKVARKLARQIAGLKLQHAQTTVSTSASVGVVSITDSAPPASELLHRARKAADELTDGNGCVLYQPPATLHPQNDSEAVKRVLTAISDRRLKLMFQPIVPLEADTETHNYEVLVRLLDENGETLAPNFFLTSIEQSDVMVKMDRWVLEHGLQQLREENDKGTKNRLFINLAGRSLHSNSLLTWFQSQLKELQVPPDQIVFQLSESDAAASLAQARRFSELASKLGCRFCLKHFGSSPNSQHVLRQLQIDYVKLDGAYIQDLESGDITVEQLHSQLLVAIERGATIIAPLVENTRVISKLFRCGIQLIQGYYLQPPRENMDYDYFQG